MWGFLSTPEKDESPLPIPAEGIFDSPTVVLCINATWVSVLDGLIGQLLNPALWDGDETETDAAIQEVHKLLIALSNTGDCP